VVDLLDLDLEEKTDGGQFLPVLLVVPWLDVKLMGADQNRLLITKKSEKKFRQKIAH